MLLKKSCILFDVVLAYLGMNAINRFFLVAYVGFSKTLSTNDATDFCEFHSIFVIYLKLPSILTELTR